MIRPAGLRPGGLALWRSLYTQDMPVWQRDCLLEACRTKDRLDALDRVLRGDEDVWMTLTTDRDGNLYVDVSQALLKSNSLQLTFLRLLAAVPHPAAAAAPVVEDTTPRTPLDELEARRQKR